ncbi:formyl-coenzyme A transferase [Aureobasidium subglaciale]|nr:formyl-coenzyme A transferase [Aureobasidium subglaciale]KAI5260077.1 formyl-coenzyme A transferase [Aureobasidium subglaciale]
MFPGISTATDELRLTVPQPPGRSYNHPYCTQILGDLGAEVIKIEHPTRGDDTRAWGPPYAKHITGTPTQNAAPGESAYFLSVNRNKKSLALSFQSPPGVKILHKLARECDVLVENYLPGALKKYGMDYQTLKEVNPKLIYASITGYGQTGPYSNRAGYDVMVEAEMGLMHITGTRDGPPSKVGVAVTDLTTGLYTSNSILASLISRSLTGRGQHIDVALSDCQVATLSNLASSHLISGKPDSGRWGTAHPSIVPYKGFETADGSIMLGGGNDRLFGVLCDRLDKSEWKSDPKFVTNAQRVANRDLLEELITTITKTKTTQQWLDVLEGSGMPYAAVNDIAGTMKHEHVLARDMVTTIDHPTCGPIKLVNTPVKYSESAPSIRSAPPTLGQHTSEVLQELGYSDAEIDGFKTDGVVS